MYIKHSIKEEKIPKKKKKKKKKYNHICLHKKILYSGSLSYKFQYLSQIILVKLLPRISIEMIMLLFLSNMANLKFEPQLISNN